MKNLATVKTIMARGWFVIAIVGVVVAVNGLFILVSPRAWLRLSTRWIMQTYRFIQLTSLMGALRQLPTNEFSPRKTQCMRPAGVRERLQ
jgi:uncharacterized protein YjeT (DUF2065 family)